MHPQSSSTPKSLPEIVSSLDALLHLKEIPDYGEALNGLQMESAAPVTRVACAVDACLPVIEMAVETGAQLLLVHHGLFWGGQRPVTGAQFAKLRMAMDAGLAIYSAHIPLDVHPVLGNNALLAKAVNLDNPEPFFPWKGIQLGLRGTVHATRDTFLQTVKKAVGSEVHIAPGGPDKIRDVGIITGGAGGEIGTLADTGIDTFITGEGPHWSYTLAEELGINLIYGGHYATETFGVKALAAWLEENFGLPWTFLDHPTGL